MSASLAGCGAAEDQGARAFEDALEDEMADGADVSVNPDDESITVEDESGSFTTGRDLDAPDWLHPALPHPDDFSIDTIISVDGISSARGTSASTAVELAGFYTSAIEGLSWPIDSPAVPTADFFQLFVTDGNGQQLDIEYVDGKLGFVIGRNRPG